MKSLRLLDRRVGFSLAAVGLLLGMVAPVVVTGFASAATEITDRSIQMSNASPSQTNTTYNVTFTPATSSGSTYMVLWFCGDTPIPMTTCAAPTGMDMSTATVGTGGTLDATAGSQGANFITLSASLTPDTPVTIPINGVTNPSGSGLTNNTFYGRIETFDSKTDADNAATGGADTITGVSDDGGVALQLVSEIGVNATVEESMTFCVSGAAPTANCASGSITSPTVNLGTETADQYILGNTLSTATDYAQISTNAVNGAVVNMKSDATGCGGLYLKADTSKCGIPPQTTTATGIAAGDGLFGATVGTESAASGATSPSGTIEPSSGYGATDYYMDYNSDGTSGVTSPYGSPLFDTSTAPVSNENVPITFGADTSPTTPAGQYTANLNMIAVGTF